MPRNTKNNAKISVIFVLLIDILSKICYCSITILTIVVDLINLFQTKGETKMAKKMRITDSKCLAMHLSIQHIEEVLDEKVRFVGVTVDSTNCGDFLSVDTVGKLEVISSGKRHEFLANVHLIQDLDGNWHPRNLDTHINMNGKSGPDVDMNLSFVKFDENGVKTVQPEPTEEEWKLIESTW